MKTVTTGSDFSGVGAFDYAIDRVAKQKGFNHERVYACDLDKYARITYAHNHGEPDYYPKDVYDRDIPKESLDIYMTSPPCQDFSMAGKRPKLSDKTVLFLNSHEFIQKNNPRYFCFENVKGLLSHDNGKTFQEWLNYLGGKSINGVPVLFPDENAVPYHVYWRVLNSKKHGVPQNRERVFIVGIRDDQDNTFRFPKEEHLTKKLKDVLESEVDEKYFLSDKMVSYLIKNQDSRALPFADGNEDNENCLTSVYHKTPTNGQYLKVKSATKKGYEEAKEGDSITLGHSKGKQTRRGRVGKGVAQTIQTAEKQATILNKSIRRLTPRECFRLQDFPDTFDFSVVSDAQAYKQAGNSITVRVLELILNNLNL